MSERYTTQMGIRSSSGEFEYRKIVLNTDNVDFKKSDDTLIPVSRLVSELNAQIGSIPNPNHIAQKNRFNTINGIQPDNNRVITVEADSIDMSDTDNTNVLTKLSNLAVGGNGPLEDSEGQLLNVGDTDTPIYFAEGIPTECLPQTDYLNKIKEIGALLTKAC